MTQRIDLTLADLRQLRDRIDRRQLQPEDWAVVGAFVSGRIAQTEARLARLEAKLSAQQGQTGEQPSSPEAPADAPAEGNDPGRGSGSDETAADKEAVRTKRKGHGRNGAAAFSNAQQHSHALAPGTLGAICGACGVGRQSAYREKVIIRIVGQPIFAAERHHFEQGRCRLCGAVIRAEGSEELVCSGIGSDYVIYHWSACAMLIVMHYFAGAPFKRLEALHRGWGVPMPDANQWRLVDQCDDLLAPLYKALEKHGIQHAINLRIDDTGSMIIELRRQIEQEVAALLLLGESTRDVRTGINATGLYIEAEEGKVVLFFTGRHHAGEIIDQIFHHRKDIAPKLVKVTDAASKNFDHSQGKQLEEAVCNAHAFLKFEAIKDKFPTEYAVAGEVYKTVFANDKEAQARGLDPDQRMHYHKTYSKPEMERLRQMCQEKIEAGLVEPNSPLWEPLSFIINQWTRLTRFYEVPGVPLDSNLVEQTLILPVRYLAGSFAYKTQNGADVGDRHMSLVATANANGVEPVAYLTECLENHQDLAQRPEYYLPWAYKARHEAAAGATLQPAHLSRPTDRPAASRSPAPPPRSHPLTIPPPTRPPPARPPPLSTTRPVPSDSPPPL